MAIKNIKSRAGAPATAPIKFGPSGRYSVCAVHTRFDAVQWFVWERVITPSAEQIAGFPEGASYDCCVFDAVIRQEPSLLEAVDGLDGSSSALLARVVLV